jgi:hypothetical protein
MTSTAAAATHSDDEELERRWRFLGCVLFANAFNVRKIVRAHMNERYICGFRHRYSRTMGQRLPELTRSDIEGTGVFSAIDPTKLTEASLNDAMYVLAGGIRTGLLAHSLPSASSPPSAYGEATPIVYRHGSADLSLEFALQHIAPGMRLPFADDLIVPEITLFVFELLRVHATSGSLAEARLNNNNNNIQSAGPHRHAAAGTSKPMQFRMHITGNSSCAFRIWDHAFLEIPIDTVFGLATPNEQGVGARAAPPPDCAVYSALCGIRELDMSLRRSFGSIHANTHDTRRPSRSTLLKYEGCRFNDAIYASYDGWFFLLNYLLEIATSIVGCLAAAEAITKARKENTKKKPESGQQQRRGKRSSTATAATTTSATPRPGGNVFFASTAATDLTALESLYFAYVRWFHSVIAVSVFARVDDQYKHPDMLRVGGVIVDEARMAASAEEWCVLTEPHDLLSKWGMDESVRPRADLRAYDYLTAQREAARISSSPTESLARALCSDTTAEFLLDPIMSDADHDVWYATHHAQFELRDRDRIWTRIRTGLGILAQTYATRVLPHTWARAMRYTCVVSPGFNDIHDEEAVPQVPAAGENPPSYPRPSALLPAFEEHPYFLGGTGVGHPDDPDDY